MFGNMKPIHIDHAPKLIKWKNKAAVVDFGNRFYSPSVFVVAFLSAFQLIDYSYSLPFLLLIAALSSVFVSCTSWTRWKKDFVYLAERELPIPLKPSVIILGSECVLQFLVSIISFWWISGVPHCIEQWTRLQRTAQGYIWMVTLTLAFFLHIFVWKLSSKEMDKCLRETYDHLDV